MSAILTLKIILLGTYFEKQVMGHCVSSVEWDIKYLPTIGSETNLPPHKPLEFDILSP